jgi:hypothetical protein
VKSKLHFTAIAAIAACFSLPSDADVIVNEFGNANGVTHGIAWDVNSTFIPTVQFMSFLDYRVTEIDVALVNNQGTNAATISLLTSTKDGLPGKVLGSWNVSGQPTADTGPLTRIRNIHGVHIEAGKNYFLRIAPADDTTIDTWTFGEVGSVTLYNGDTLAYASTNAPAFDVIGYVPSAADGAAVE